MSSIDISKWKVDSSDFEPDPEKGNAVNSGSNGIVTFCVQKSTGIRCVKKKTMKRLKEEEVRRNFNREVSILGTYKHPALVPFIGYYEHKKSGFILLKNIEKGSLDINIKKNNKDGVKDPLWDDTHKLIIAYGIACAMEFLHSDNIIHRDLKPANILLDSQLHPYVSDFGTSKRLDPSLSIHQTISGTSPIIMAPEFFQDPFNTKDNLSLDYYAYAITIYHLITGLIPFEKYALLTIMNAVTSGERPPIPDYVPAHWKKLIEECWSQNPESRPNFTSICNTLESKQFLNNSIDLNVFKRYQKLVKPLRPISSSLSSSKSKSGDLNSISKPKLTKKETATTESPVLINLREEAKKGKNFSSILAYADALFTGKYGSQDLDEARNLYISVCNSDDSTNKEKQVAEYYAGKCFAIQKNYEMANKLLSKSVLHGDPNAAFYLGELILSKKIKPYNLNRIDSLYKIAANAGIPKAIKNYAFMNYTGFFNGIPNTQLANEYFKRGSDNGDPELMHIWAIRNEFGRGDVKKNPNEAMKLMKYAAEELNYAPAQFDYALHLYNGIIVPKDQDEAEKFFEMAAISGHPTAMLYHYLYLSKSDEDEDREAAKIFFDNCFNQNLIDQRKVDPDAWAINGKKLIESGNIDIGLQNLHYAFSSGSITAMNTLGNLAENDPEKYGDPKFYYERSANHCHCLDTIGFTTPIEYKLFHCNDCDLDMCEGCAKHCHRNHSVTEVCIESGFKCQCGAKGYKGHCTGEIIGQECCYQHLYQCELCQLHKDNVFICKGCAEKCHHKHHVVDCGIQKGFCSCGMKNMPTNTKCKLIDFETTESCSLLTYWTDPIMQRWFGCLTCNLCDDYENGVCENCAKSCHSDHIVVDLGVKNQSCKCMINNKCNF